MDAILHAAPCVASCLEAYRVIMPCLQGYHAMLTRSSCHDACPVGYLDDVCALTPRPVHCEALQHDDGKQKHVVGLADLRSLPQHVKV